MKRALVLLLVAACTEEPTFLHSTVGILLTTDDPADATYRELDADAFAKTHTHGDTTTTVTGIEIRIEIDGLAIEEPDFDAVVPTLRGYPAEIRVVGDEESRILPLSPFFTSSVQATDTGYAVTFDPPVRTGERAYLAVTAADGFQSIELAPGAASGVIDGQPTHVSMVRAIITDYDGEGLRIGGTTDVSRILVLP
jgi:hypothetical protein